MRYITLAILMPLLSILGCDRSPAPATAPASTATVTRADLVFQWDDYFADNQLEDEAGNYIICQVQPKGRAFFDASGAMDCAGGTFELDGLPATFAESAAQAGGITILFAAYLTHESDGTILSVGGNKLLSKEADMIHMFANNIQQGTVQFAPEGWHHFGVSLDWHDEPRAHWYINGVRHLSVMIRGTVASPLPVVFGGDTAQHDRWAGRIRDVKIYKGVMGTNQADRIHHGWQADFALPTMPEPVGVRATLVEKSAVPAVDQLDTYRRALVGHVYETEQLGRILVYQWAIMDLQPIERFVALTEGQAYNLSITPFDDNPQLQGELTTTDSDEFNLPIYYDKVR